jgi:hypothetical protein
MASKGKNKEREDFWGNASQQAYQQNAAPTPLQSAWEKQQTDFLNWDESKGKDVRSAPGMDKYIQLADAARNRASIERNPTGAMALGDLGDSGYAAQLQNQRQKESDQDIGSGLENALNLRRAEASGSVIPLAQLNQSRNANNMSFAGGMYNNIADRNKRPGFWQNLLMAGIAGGSQVASSFATGGAG